MKIKTENLTGRALDYAVAICDGWSTDYLDKNHDAIPEYSTDWSECGNLISNNGIEFNWISDAAIEAHSYLLGDAYGWGDDHLEAACRMIVIANFDKEIEIPDELIEQESK
ncbi:phage protein NinX family protein [Photorhabdus sp. RM71S]|uniref:phage protein NinX family protein n=1 Tax=Photorhabdus sp. RM71S TaxID=3342824 RepID=UPI0036DA6F72